MFKAKPSGRAGSAQRSATIFCGYRDVRFNLDSHVVAVAEKMLSHRLYRLCWIPHVSSPGAVGGATNAHGQPFI
jgi:hypothetical protein